MSKLIAFALVYLVLTKACRKSKLDLFYFLNKDMVSDRDWDRNRDRACDRERPATGTGPATVAWAGSRV